MIAKQKKKSKQDHEEALRSEVNIGSNNPIDVDEMESSFGGIKEPNTFGPINRFKSSFSGGSQSKMKRKQEEVSNVFKKEQEARVKEYVTRWAFECGIPFHAFERDSFKMMVEVIGQFGPWVPTPTRYELGETLLKKEVERMKMSLKTYEDEWKLTGCSIMTDAWTDRKRSVMNLCVNSKLGAIFLSSKECLSEAHTSETIFEYVEGCIVQVGHKNVVQIVTDNASNNMGAAKLLKEKRPTIFWTSCAAHSINLMLEGIGMIDRYKKVIDQAKKLTIFIYAHHKTLAMMKQYTLKGDIVRPGVTRFASAFLTLQSLADKKTSLRQMFVSEDWDKCNFFKTVKWKICVCNGGISHILEWRDHMLERFCSIGQASSMVDADWEPSMGFLYGELQNAIQEIKEACSNNQKSYDPILKIISSKMKGRLDTSLHKAAYLLNPFYLYNDLEVQKDVAANEALLDVVETLFLNDATIQNLILMVELPKYKRKLESFGRIGAQKGCETNNDNYDPRIGGRLMVVHLLTCKTLL